jgi:hypothetical protein
MAAASLLAHSNKRSLFIGFDLSHNVRSVTSCSTAAACAAVGSAINQFFCAQLLQQAADSA